VLLTRRPLECQLERLVSLVPDVLNESVLDRVAVAVVGVGGERRALGDNARHVGRIDDGRLGLLGVDHRPRDVPPALGRAHSDATDVGVVGGRRTCDGDDRKAGSQQQGAYGGEELLEHGGDLLGKGVRGSLVHVGVSGAHGRSG
jgi:hypothetical protein